MGKKDSSSKRKSSKRKSLKINSQKKKKSRRNKSRKSRDAEYSVSSYSDDESKSLLSGSKSDYSSSSEDDHKTRKGRSRARGEAKSCRKKVRRRSSSVESNPKKRKRSKKDVKLRLRKKSRKGKRKRDVSLSSVSESQSYSSDSSEEREPRRKRGRSRESKKHRRDRSKVKIKIRNSRSESPSGCSYSRDNHHTDSMSHGEEEIAPEYRSRRIRSVITVVRREEEDVSEKDRYGEEMIYDRYDYPSSRSNDSNDGVSKNEPAYYSNIALDKTETGGNETNEKEDLAEYDITDHSTHAGDPGPFYGTREAEIEHGDVSSVVSEPAQDLELLLRQKALENRRKFLVEKQKQLKTKARLEGQSETRFNETSSETSVKEKNNISSSNVNVKLESASPASRQETVLSNPVMKPRKPSQAPAFNSSGTSPAKSPSLTPSSNNNQATEVVVGVSSSTGNELEVSEPSLEKIATEQQDQSKDGLQYEKKTMSVMRGGEMVQVSYKVYIPKKTPALHRRQLRR